jgi:DNA polymerase V
MMAIVDCNSFYCSCERLFRPDLASRPVVVLSNNDGCIIARTDEAKALGIDMASPFYQQRAAIARHGVTVFSSNYNLYGDLSMRVMDTLRQIAGAERVEVYSVDEAFVNLDIVPVHQLAQTAKHLKDTVEEWTGIKVSVGVAPTKTLAKMANRLSKKDKAGTQGVMVLATPDAIDMALSATAVADIWGVGRQYALKLQNWGIHTAYQLKQMPQEWARKHLGGVVGARLVNELNGQQCIAIKDPLEVKKMIATTRMFGRPVYELSQIKEAVATYTCRAAEKLRRQYGAASVLEVFVVTNGRKPNEPGYQPQSVHRHVELPTATACSHELIKQAMPLVTQIYTPGLKYLKAGVILSGIVPDTAIQGSLFVQVNNQHRGLMNVLDNINFSQRDDVIKYAASGLTRNWKMRQELRSKRFTTRWDELYAIR